MNYARIYADFIRDRLAKQPSKPTYYETHHIKPRCLGGGNEPSNLIRLVPEEHLFAHILLAKIHGGKLWMAVHAMCHLVNEHTAGHRLLGFRSEFGYVRRSIARHYRDSFSGPLGPQADKTNHTLHHHDGRAARGNRFELEAVTGIPRQQISALLNGTKKTNRGWYSKLHNSSGLTRSQSISAGVRSKEPLVLFNENGDSWRGTRWDFANQFGTQPDFSKNTSCLGWYRTALEAVGHSSRSREIAAAASRSRGDITGSRNPMFGADRRKSRTIKVVHRDGRTFSGCSVAFADQIGAGSAPAYQRMMKTLRGKKVVDGLVVKSFKGWTALEVDP